jgi:hypothetical protein
MRYAHLLAGGLACGLFLVPATRAASAMLEKVKQDPALAKSLCARFTKLNESGQSATSRESVEMVAKTYNMNMVDAEVFITYVIGLHCSNVR